MKGKVTVSDLATGKVLVEKDYDVPVNAAAVIDRVSWTGQGVLSIKYEQGGEKHSNWFLYGEPPFDFHTIAALLTEARK